MVPRLRPDVVLMDLRMPVLDGAAATRLIAALADAPAVLILTTYDTDADIVRAVEAGAAGYLLKDAEPAVLADAVMRAARGETVLAPGIADRLADSGGGDVLRLAAQGKSNAAIGRHLFIGEATVKTYLSRTYAKLDVGDRAAAVAAAYRLGLLT